MDDFVFEIIDKTKREIRLTKRQWRHINNRHPIITNYIEELKETLKNPDAIKNSKTDENVYFYYKYFKYLKSPDRYILLIVKYLNSHGFIISTFFEKYIK